MDYRFDDLEDKVKVQDTQQEQLTLEVDRHQELLQGEQAWDIRGVDSKELEKYSVQQQEKEYVEISSTPEPDLESMKTQE